MPVIALGLVSLSANAQPRVPKALQRFQVGYSFPKVNAEYRYMLDSMTTEKVSTKGGFGVTMGTSIPLTKIGDQSSLTFGIDGLFNMLVWDYENVEDDYASYSSSTGYSQQYTVTGGTMQISVPLGIDFKFGGEANLLKRPIGFGTLGAGVMPTAALTAYQGDAGAVIKALPYLKGELGIYAGVGIKLRAIYSMGTFDYIKQKGNNPYASESASLKAKSNFTFSILIMPFAWAWNRYDW